MMVCNLIPAIIRIASMIVMLMMRNIIVMMMLMKLMIMKLSVIDDLHMVFV